VIGHVALRVVEATGIVPYLELGSDCFAEISLGQHTFCAATTRLIQRTTTPHWDEHFLFPLVSPFATIRITLFHCEPKTIVERTFHRDRSGPENPEPYTKQPLGEVILPLSIFADDLDHSVWVNLRPCGVALGERGIKQLIQATDAALGTQMGRVINGIYLIDRKGVTDDRPCVNASSTPPRQEEYIETTTTTKACVPKPVVVVHDYGLGRIHFQIRVSYSPTAEFLNHLMRYEEPPKPAVPQFSVALLAHNGTVLFNEVAYTVETVLQLLWEALRWKDPLRTVAFALFVLLWNKHSWMLLIFLYILVVRHSVIIFALRSAWALNDIIIGQYQAPPAHPAIVTSAVLLDSGWNAGATTAPRREVISDIVKPIESARTPQQLLSADPASASPGFARRASFLPNAVVEEVVELANAQPVRASGISIADGAAVGGCMVMNVSDMDRPALPNAPTTLAQVSGIMRQDTFASETTRGPDVEHATTTRMTTAQVGADKNSVLSRVGHAYRQVSAFIWYLISAFFSLEVNATTQTARNGLESAVSRAKIMALLHKVMELVLGRVRDTRSSNCSYKPKVLTRQDVKNI
jgi:hypothetical protein